jgi:hypothetical protein
MNEVIHLVSKARECGAIFILDKDRVVLRAPEPLPADLMDKLRIHKTEIQQLLRQSQKVKNDNWILEEWRRISIPHWRHILQDSITNEDKKREEYARWMLSEILEDANYKEIDHDGRC